MQVPNVTVEAGGTATVNFRLAAVPLSLQAVVTTGVTDPTSGTRVPFTVGRLEVENIPVPSTNAIESIQGKVAAVTIVPPGQPGSGTNILLRSMLVSEMDLLKAEGLIRLGRAAEAVPLINKTRVANGQLPPVTVDGPPDEPGCVPRKLNGQCGSLWDALRYEKRIEGLGVSAVIAYFDARGWQTLPANSIL